MHFVQLKNNKIEHPADSTYYFLNHSGIIRHLGLILPFLSFFDRTDRK